MARRVATAAALLLLAAPLAPALSLRRLKGLRRAAAEAVLAPAALLGSGANAATAGAAAVAAAAIVRPQAAVASSMMKDKGSKASELTPEEIELARDTAEWLQATQDPEGVPGARRFKIWFLRKPWSVRSFEDKFKDVPVFVVTNANGDPYFTPAEGHQIGRFYFDPRDAQDVLDEFLQDQSTPGARISCMSMTKALDMLGDAGEKAQEQDYLKQMHQQSPGIGDREYGLYDIPFEDRTELTERKLKWMDRRALLHVDEMEKMDEDFRNEQPIVIWEFITSLRSAEALLDLQNRGANPATATSLADMAPMVYCCEGMRTRRGGEEVMPFFASLEDLQRAYDRMAAAAGEENPPEMTYKAFQLYDVLRNMLIGAEGWEKVSIEPMREGRKFVRKAKQLKSAKATLIDPADVIGRRG